MATEPVTLAEAKNHLRLTSSTFVDDITTTQSITPGEHAVSEIEGAAVDVLGYITMACLNAGTCAGSVAAKVQESDDNISWQDFGSFTTVTASNDDAVQEMEYTGGKRYIRVYATITSAACSFGADVITKSGDAVEDDQISAWITAAREYCEKITGRALATQTIEAYMDGFPYRSEFELPRPPLQSVTSVKYKDSDGDETTMTADTDYIVDTDRDVGRVVLPYGKTWPSFTAYTVNPIKVRYVAGYYASNLIPKSIKQAMLLLVGYWYDNREAVLTGQGAVSKKLELAADSLLSLYRVTWM